MFPILITYILCGLVPHLKHPTNVNSNKQLAIVFEQTQRCEKFYFKVMIELCFCLGQLASCINGNVTNKITTPINMVLVENPKIYYHFFQDIILYLRKRSFSWKGIVKIRVKMVFIVTTSSSTPPFFLLVFDLLGNEYCLWSQGSLAWI